MTCTLHWLAGTSWSTRRAVTCATICRCSCAWRTTTSCCQASSAWPSPRHDARAQAGTLACVHACSCATLCAFRRRTGPRSACMHACSLGADRPAGTSLCMHAGWSHFAQFTIAVVNKDPKKSKYSGRCAGACEAAAPSMVQACVSTGDQALAGKARAATCNEDDTHAACPVLACQQRLLLGRPCMPCLAFMGRSLAHCAALHAQAVRPCMHAPTHPPMRMAPHPTAPHCRHAAPLLQEGA